jgi:hypothetical protein
MTRECQLAQINAGTIKYQQDDLRMRGFINRRDEINAPAEQGSSGNATDTYKQANRCFS